MAPPEPSTPCQEKALRDWAEGVVVAQGLRGDLLKLEVATKADAVAGIVPDAIARCDAIVREIAAKNGVPDPFLESQGNGNGSPAASPRVYTAEELMDLTPEVPEAVLGGYIYKGSVTELASKVKTGKTTLLLAACRAITRGEEFIGHATRRERILYLTEERPSTFAAAMRRVGLTSGDDFRVVFRHDVGTMTWPEVCDWVARYATSEAIGVVSVDTVSDWAGLSGDEENQAGSALEALRPVQAIAACGPAVVVVRHERKSGGELGESARGSSAFAGAVDVLMALRATTEDNRRELHAKGRFDATPPRVVIELSDDGHFSALGDPRTLRHLEEQRAVIDALGSDRGHALTLDDLRDAAGGVSRTSAQRVIGELQSEGLVCAERGVVPGHPRAFGYWLRGDDD